VIALAAGTLTMVGAAAVLLAGGGSRATIQGHRSHSKSPGTVPPGAIVYARNTGSGVFRDDAGPIRLVSPGGAALGPSQGASTCCFAPSPTPRLVALRLSHGVVVVSSRGIGGVPRPRAARTLRLVPGAISADGRRIAMSGTDHANPLADGIYTDTLPSRTIRRVTRASPKLPQRALSFSPDGSRLLIFQHAKGAFGSIAVVPTAGGGSVRPIGRTESMCCYFGAPASWSPDGRQIAFAGFIHIPGLPLGQSAVFVADATGRHIRRLTDWGSWTTSARWSPSGDWIVFDREQNTGNFHEELLVHPDGSGLHVVNTNTVTRGSCCAQWSPDGRDLLYEHGNGNSGVALWMVSADGPARPRRITGTGGGYLSFAWVR
jgi:WD40 repeat protein